MLKAQVISFSCILKNRLGHTISESIQSEVVNSVNHAGQLDELVRGLQNVRRGERRTIEVQAEKAYGFYDPDLFGQLERNNLSEGKKLSVGDTLNLYSPEQRYSKLFRVVEATPEFIHVDGNHPLAGQDLIFEVEILDARDLGPEEDSDLRPKSGKRTLH